MDGLSEKKGKKNWGRFALGCKRGIRGDRDVTGKIQIRPVGIGVWGVDACAVRRVDGCVVRCVDGIVVR